MPGKRDIFTCKQKCYFTRENNMFSQVRRSPLLWLHNPSTSTYTNCCMIDTLSVLPWKSSVIFGNLQKMFGNVCLAFGQLSENLRKSSEIVKKAASNMFIYQNNTWLLVDMEFLFECLTLYLTRSLRSLVRYKVEHSKRNSISACTHVLSEITHKQR